MNFVFTGIMITIKSLPKHLANIANIASHNPYYNKDFDSMFWYSTANTFTFHSSLFPFCTTSVQVDKKTRVPLPWSLVESQAKCGKLHLSSIPNKTPKPVSLLYSLIPSWTSWEASVFHRIILWIIMVFILFCYVYVMIWSDQF